jgi:hypothetical protein
VGSLHLPLFVFLTLSYAHDATTVTIPLDSSEEQLPSTAVAKNSETSAANILDAIQELLIPSKPTVTKALGCPP